MSHRDFYLCNTFPVKTTCVYAVVEYLPVAWRCVSSACLCVPLCSQSHIQIAKVDHLAYCEFSSSCNAGSSFFRCRRALLRCRTGNWMCVYICRPSESYASNFAYSPQKARRFTLRHSVWRLPNLSLRYAQIPSPDIHIWPFSVRTSTIVSGGSSQIYVTCSCPCSVDFPFCKWQMAFALVAFGWQNAQGSLQCGLDSSVKKITKRKFFVLVLIRAPTAFVEPGRLKNMYDHRH